ncbi:RrF2 family transcriptional regulator [Geofilum rubicundum]|uniref:Iron-sulfur cluster regulator IscR n=1 Tax=Geofilum rubicundum JCM 15548 TaxID=1236989 RepID=A0A0E9M0S2_9BACT|nr:Rrf2 family transcriptional regulator [Geofilum rubicundum]GAO31153.1 iron-sulfur cluster regulator IscR [Geofilum rubicundum JCM 15548]
MKITTKTRYGLRAMVEIARETNNEGILQKEISLRQKLSNKYLDQIILALKSANLIMNVHGKKSGYILAKPADSITLLDIHQAFEPAMHMVDCLAPNYVCEKEARCSSKLFWQGLNNVVVDYFNSFTLQQILDKQTELESIPHLSSSNLTCHK